MKNMGGGVYLHVSKNGVIDVLSEEEPIKHPDITIASILTHVISHLTNRTPNFWMKGVKTETNWS